MIDAIKRNMTWRAVPIAGLIGGTAYLLLVMGLSPIWLGMGDLVILRYSAGLVLGSNALIDPSSGVLFLGVVVHYVLSMVFALVITIVIHRWGLITGIVGGAVLGLCLYAINLYTLTLFFPWFFAINSGLIVLAHGLFGAVVGGVYESLDHFDVTGGQAVSS